MLEGILKGLLQWLYGLLLEIVAYIADGLLEVFSMNLEYFQAVAPVTSDIVSILIACGWALLLGNLVFQAAKTMMSGLGFEGEDPRTLFARTFVFGFLLLASRQVCEIGLGLAGAVIDLLGVPNRVQVSLPGENVFSIGASWLLVILIGLVLMWQLVKLFFEIGERYFIVAFLTLTAPLAFATGGSRNTADIFKGWARMYGSMCLMMTLNVVFLKLLLSAMGNMPDGAGVLPWMVLVVAIARVARKADELVMRIGLNPAMTGGGLGMRFPGMLSAMVLRTVTGSVVKAAAANGAGTTKAAGLGQAPASGAANQRGGKPGNRHTGAAANTAASVQNHASPSTAAGTDTAVPDRTAGNESDHGRHTSSRKSSFAQTVRGRMAPPGMTGSRGRSHDTAQSRFGHTPQTPEGGRPSAVHTPPGMSGIAGMKPQNPAGIPSSGAKPGAPAAGLHAAAQHTAPPGTAKIHGQESAGTAPKPTRYTHVPPGLRGAGRHTASPDTAGTRRQQSHIQSGSTEHSARQDSATSETNKAHGRAQKMAGAAPVPPGIRGAAGTAGNAARRTAVPSSASEADKRGILSTTSAQRSMSTSAKEAPSRPTPSTPVSPQRPPAPQETRASVSARASEASPRPDRTAGKNPAGSRAFGDKSPPAQRTQRPQPPGIRGSAGQSRAAHIPSPGGTSQPNPPGHNNRRRPKS